MCEIERDKRERERQEFYRVHTFSKLILNSWLRCFVSLHDSDHAEAIRICDASHWDTRKSVLPRNSTDIRVRWIPTMISSEYQRWLAIILDYVFEVKMYIIYWYFVRHSIDFVFSVRTPDLSMSYIVVDLQQNSHPSRHIAELQPPIPIDIEL